MCHIKGENVAENICQCSLLVKYRMPISRFYLSNHYHYEKENCFVKPKITSVSASQRGVYTKRFFNRKCTEKISVMYTASENLSKEALLYLPSYLLQKISSLINFSLADVNAKC